MGILANRKNRNEDPERKRLMMVQEDLKRIKSERKATKKREKNQRKQISALRQNIYKQKKMIKERDRTQTINIPKRSK